jgi:hypothetical protein
MVADGSWARGGDEVVIGIVAVAVAERIEVGWADVDISDGGKLGVFGLGGGRMIWPGVGRVFAVIEGMVLPAGVAVAVVAWSLDGI